MDIRFYWVNIESTKANKTYFWNKAQPIWLIILTNIIHLTIITTLSQYIYTIKIMLIMQRIGCVIPFRKLDYIKDPNNDQIMKNGCK